MLEGRVEHIVVAVVSAGGDVGLDAAAAEQMAGWETTDAFESLGTTEKQPKGEYCG